MFDPESPIQDADIEMAELTAAANKESRLRKRGICAHGWIQGPPGPWNKPTTVWTCQDCGKVFQSENDLMEERRNLLD